MKKLVIVESPSKARTISYILGKDYTILATYGHVQDLPRDELGVNVEDGFCPTYVVLPGKEKIIHRIVRATQKSSEVYLATDPDREGEAISWHVARAANIEKGKRIVFHEITPREIEKAITKPREIDLNLVNSQQARRILDRLVGYKISPILWKKIRGRLSAGRVQSVALKFIVDRDREIQNFTPHEYWEIFARLKNSEGAEFEAQFDGQLGSEAEVGEFVPRLREAKFSVRQVEKKEVEKWPPPPHRTSTLEQEAWYKLGFTAHRTMSLAQKLYEGLPLADGKSVGLITYMRTDSSRVSPLAVKEVRSYIEQNFDPPFLPSKPRLFKSKVKGAQEAHEAIRPTKVYRLPSDILPFVDEDIYKLYNLIWLRMVQSQMAPARWENTVVAIDAGEYVFWARGKVVKFPGFSILTGIPPDEKLPSLKEGEVLTLCDLSPKKCFTQPPPHYSEATLIQELESKGIGRPSTYAPILSTLRQRGYVMMKGGKLYHLPIGEKVSDFLCSYFPHIMDAEFTADMEESLDDIASGKKEWVEVISSFYLSLEKNIGEALGEKA
jgi:DNA topoisomerase-1